MPLKINSNNHEPVKFVNDFHEKISIFSLEYLLSLFLEWVVFVHSNPVLNIVQVGSKMARDLAGEAVQIANKFGLVMDFTIYGTL